jgi:hypothetical protein
MMAIEISFEETLEKFLASNDFADALIKATRTSWGGSGFSVELFPNGTWRVLWNNEIGNLYDTPGVILKLPTLDDDDYQEAVVNNGMDEEEFFYLTYENDVEELAQSMRTTLAE